MKDLFAQISFVSSAIERILWQIDHDPLSPTFGCAHLDYWRDKTSDVADMRRQEVVLPIALLYHFDYPGSTWKGNEKLKHAVNALLAFWSRNQYSDGSMDEWYKGERAYAAAAFSSHAVARTLEIAGDDLPRELFTVTKDKLEKTAYWLTRRNDLFKTNHQAVGIAALAWSGKILQDDTLTENAYEKLESIIDAQTKEGWFPEVGHMDVGYTFLTVEFVTMVMELWSNWEGITVFQRAFDFACEWIHPDLTIGDEYGVCHNPYLSRIAVILMSKYSGRASYIQQRLARESLGFKGFTSVLADDLRLFRWAYQPLLAYDYARKTTDIKSAEAEIIPLVNSKSEICIYEEAALVRFSKNGCTGIIAAASGGLIRLFGTGSVQGLSDFGYAIDCKDGYATNYTYNRKLEIENINGSIAVTCPILKVKKFMPSFWSRVALHLACTTSFGSRWTRKCIDIIRRKEGTAINQSSSNLSAAKTPWSLRREIKFQQDHLIVVDNINLKGMINLKELFFLESVNDGWMIRQPVSARLSNLPEKLTYLQITKTYYPGECWKLGKTSASW